ncbi:antirestriction protein ArdA [Chroococcidiopsis sp.]|uniref:antirestriction protein ArdA n=1 Tax=Chroococcidiopsis sp. TaxID=3088168 RepID=UPI003F407649
MSKIYVMDIARYNQGQLRGTWLSLTSDVTPKKLRTQIKHFLSETQAEEWTIEDREGLAGYDGSDLSQICAIVNAIEQYGEEEIKGFLIEFGEDADLSEFNDRYLGLYGSVENYCQEAVQLPDEILNTGFFDGRLEFYIDWESIAEDAQVNWISCYKTKEGYHIYSKRG